MASISATEAGRLEGAASGVGVQYVASLVLGPSAVAAEGKLSLLLARLSEALDAVARCLSIAVRGGGALANHGDTPMPSKSR